VDSRARPEVSDTPYPFDQDPPIAVPERQLRDDNGSIGCPIEQSSSRLDTRSPPHTTSLDANSGLTFKRI
jgi:hypothetical protein